ncbi:MULTISPECIES: hypothetical protein [unclassified Bradyrhizobium]|uniref:hypothetical protein n=1 Tax=unclassified Bradyrhizobium TaxID=2631580 RepID=UPI0033941CA7
MRGTITVIHPDGTVESKVLDHAAKLDDLKSAIGGGYMEKIPRFTKFKTDTGVVDCIALCDEDGSRKNMSPNRTATLAWSASLAATDPAQPVVLNTLVGPVAILYGDKEWMKAL